MQNNVFKQLKKYAKNCTRPAMNAQKNVKTYNM